MILEQANYMPVEATVAAVKKRQSATERKPVILNAFYDVIEELGFENASVAKVAQKARVHPSLVIHYFGTKELMVTALVDETLKIYSRLIARLPREGEPEARLEQLLTLLWSREWHRAVSFPVIFSLLAVSRRNEEVMNRVRDLYRSYQHYLTKQISFFSEAAIIRIDNTEAAVQALISLSEGSHYFSDYHVGEELFDTYCQNMKNAARRILGAP